MSYYAGFMKAGGKVDPSIYEIKDYSTLESLQKKIRDEQKRIVELQEELANKKEKLIVSRYTPTIAKRYVHYCRTDDWYDWDTCCLVDEPSEEKINSGDVLIFSTQRVSSEATFFCGYDLANGVGITATYSVNIDNAKSRLKHKFLRQNIIAFTDKSTFYSQNGYCIYSNKEVKFLIDNFFDCDYKGKLTLDKLADYYRRNKSFEIIIKEAPDEIKDKLLRQEFQTVMPMHKILGVTRPTYIRLLEEGLIDTLCALRYDRAEYTYCRSYDKDKFFVPENETQLIEALEAFRRAAEEFTFFHTHAVSYPSSGDSLTTQIAKVIFGNYYARRLIKENYSLNHFYDYVLVQVNQQGYSELNSFIDELYDYLRMCSEMKTTPTLYSGYLQQTHNVCQKNHKVMLDEQQEKTFKTRYKEFKTKKVNENYYVVVPECSQDLKREGDVLNHCVASYIHQVIKGECLIFFLRKEVDKPLITFEFRNGRVCQVRGIHNRAATAEERAAITAWEKSLQVQQKLC